MKKIAFIFISIMMAGLSQAQTIGKIVDSETNEPLPGAKVYVNGSKIGTSTNSEGVFSIANGGKDVTISFIGYATQLLASPSGDAGVVRLTSNSISLKELLVVANAAVDRKTPVAVSTIKAAEIQNMSGNKEFPELMKFTPSVYVSKEGGGFGDSRINIRGYGQEDVGVMINGVPVNDMENGAVYWSNWAGLSDVANQIQVQRGLGASRVSNSAIGGTINIVTKTAELSKGGSVFAGLGNNGMMEAGTAYNTGLLSNGIAVSALIKYTQGNGYIDGTNFQGATYFFSMSKKFNNKHTLQFSVTGAPQWHFQNFGTAYRTFYGDSANVYGGTFTFEGYGRQYNSNWGYLNGDVYSMNKNFYHKPIAYLNHFFNINNKTSLNTAIYYSEGRGGGTGAFNSLGGKNFNQIVDSTTNTVNYDFIYTNNLDTNGIVRYASMNEHNWYGLVSTLKTQLSSDFSLLAGVDFRGYEGMHYRKIEDFLGSNVYKETKNVNQNPLYATDGSTHINRDYNGNVGQMGGFATLEYAKDKLSAQITGTVNNTSYYRTEFMYQSIASDTNVTAKQNFLGYNVKGGVNYNLNAHSNVFLNAGHFARAPFFTTVFRSTYDKYGNILNGTPTNEKITALELGYGFTGKKVAVKLNAYSTSWKDKAINRTYSQGAFQYNQVLQGITAQNQGVELEISARPIHKLTLKAMASFGDWKYTSDASSLVFDGINGALIDTLSKTAYIKGVKMGNAAQATGSIFAEYEVANNLYLNANYHHNGNLYANFAPLDRVTDTTRRQAWKLPSYGLVDLGARYVLNLKNNNSLTFKVNVSNLLNTEFLYGATTDRAYYKADGITRAVSGTYLIPGSINGSSSNTVYNGLGRTWYFGLKYQF